MGFKIPKIKIKAPKISAPKITLGDPTKLISKPIEGMVNSMGSITKTAVGNVGEIMATPGAAAVIDGASVAMGMPPGLGSMLAPPVQKNSDRDQAQIAETIYPQVMPAAEKPGMNKNTMLMIGGGFGFLVLIVLAITLKGKK